MNPSRVAAILGACRTGVADVYWQEAADRLASERNGVEALLESGVPVYGFTTYLGQLDRYAAPRDSSLEAELLQAHLVGPLSVLPASSVRLVTACKLEQLSHGGSGIDPTTFDSLLAQFAQEPDTGALGCWSSYGAGDVVPAAWWLNSLSAKGAMTLDHRGDVITLINGSFLSTALALEAALSFADFAGSLLALLGAHAYSGRLDSGWEPDALAAWLNLRVPPAGSATPQLPLSVRDIEPIGRAFFNAIARLRDAIDARLSSPSANPLFVSKEGATVALSQNSYLDFDLTFALTNARQACMLGLGALQRLAHHLSMTLQSASPIPQQFLIQPPKILSAMLIEAQLTCAVPSVFTGDDSEGIEDLHDLSLMTARSLANCTREYALPGLRVVLDMIPDKVDLSAGVAAANILLAK